MNLDQEDFEELPDQEIFQDEISFKKQITKLTRDTVRLNRANEMLKEEQKKDTAKLIKQQERALQNNVEFYEDRIESIKEQIGQLIEKNLELHETSKLFAKALELLRQDNRIITKSHLYHIRDGQDLVKKIDDLTKPVPFGYDPKYRIKAVTVTKTNSYGQPTEAIITTEHTEKILRK